MPRPDLPDLSASHEWRGQNQPPVGVRAQQVLNWARDEDVDRRRDFAREWREASAWVEDQLLKGSVGDNTRRLLLAAQKALAAHGQFEDYHYRRLASLEVFDPESLPKYKTRLDYREEHPIQLGNPRPKDLASTLINRPGREQPRPPMLVNDMWRSDAERELDPSLETQRPASLRSLANDENTFWQRQAGDPEPEGTSSAALETRAYRLCIAEDNAGFQAWTHLGLAEDGSTRIRTILGDTPLHNDALSFAAERGARRAGLQGALRQFSSAENRDLDQDGSGLLVLPLQQGEVPSEEDNKRKAGIGDGRPLDIPSLPDDQMEATQEKMDPQGYTANMAQFWRRIRSRMEEARERYMAVDGPARGPTAAFDNGDRVSYNPNVPLPPASVFGPYVWRGVSPDAQIDQDLLREMRALKRLFDREQNIAPRQLLRDMKQWYRNGYSGGQAPQWVAARDLNPRSRKPRGLDKIELEWIRSLLNQSIRPGMVTNLQPRTTLFIKFAERLSRIFKDPGDTLFGKLDTFVSIEDLLSHMDKMKGPVNKIKFYHNDVKLWLQRLHVQGRCRFTEDWRTHGLVQRPVPVYFPEDLIVWRERTDFEVDFETHPEDMSYAPRFDDRRTWRDVLEEKPEQLDQNVSHYFHCLSYRWGRAVSFLEQLEKPPTTANPVTWLSGHAIDFKKMQNALTVLEGRFRDAIKWDADERSRRQPMGMVENTPVVELMQRTLNRSWDANDAAERITTDSALRTIRRGIIDECVRSDSMLFPGRSTDYTDPAAWRTRDAVWDWAKPAVRGEVKGFFGLDRWPLQLLTKDARRRVESCVDDDPQQTFDAMLEDPTPRRYHVNKARPYADTRVKFNDGPRSFPVGDTPRQREVVTNRIMWEVAESE